MILNLVNNAWYATRTSWLADKARFSPTIAVSTKNLGSAIEIRVRDNGAGIPEAVRDKGLQPLLLTTKPHPDGVGLGALHQPRHRDPAQRRHDPLPRASPASSPSSSSSCPRRCSEPAAEA